MTTEEAEKKPKKAKSVRCWIRVTAGSLTGSAGSLSARRLTDLVPVVATGGTVHALDVVEVEVHITPAGNVSTLSQKPKNTQWRSEHGGYDRSRLRVWGNKYEPWWAPRVLYVSSDKTVFQRMSATLLHPFHRHKWTEYGPALTEHLWEMNKKVNREVWSIREGARRRRCRSDYIRASDTVRKRVFAVLKAEDDEKAVVDLAVLWLRSKKLWRRKSDESYVLWPKDPDASCPGDAGDLGLLAALGPGNA